MNIHNTTGPGRLAQSGASLTANQVVVGSRIPARLHTFVEIYHELTSTAILPIPPIQEMQMADSGESMCTKNTG